MTVVQRVFCLQNKMNSATLEGTEGAHQQAALPHGTVSEDAYKKRLTYINGCIVSHAKQSYGIK